MPKLKEESFQTGDQTWLASMHGVWNGRTAKLDISAFTAGTHYPNGYIPSGTPVGMLAGLLVPYDSLEATTTNAGVLEGHILTDQPVVGTADFSVPILDHARVKTSKVPVGVQTFVAPVAAAKRARTNIIYV